MSELKDVRFVPEDFSGKLRLFPLPNLVMFPHVMQPLHIFEPRYCDLLEEALVDDRLIGMVLLRPGWEKDYEGRPPVHQVACLGHVTTHEKQPDGRHNVLLLGLCRARLREELPSGKLFRVAAVDLLSDDYPASTKAERPDLQKRLINEFRGAVPSLLHADKEFSELLESGLELGMLTDIIACALNLDLQSKQQLLEELDVDRRAVLLLERLRRGPRTDFPPEFSAN